MAGIYIHVPFCKSACHYCNFHFSTNLALQNDFTGALLKEIELRVSYLGMDTVETIYFGGGTPSLLPSEAIFEIIDSVHKKFSVSVDSEITLESNPDDMDIRRLREWKKAGINRLSIGVQSFFTDDLLLMNRVHDSQQSILAVEQTRDAGFDNFSIDLIYGMPYLTDIKWNENLLRAISMNPAHISCYALTVEPKTALFKMIQQKKISDIKPEEQAAQFLSGIKVLEATGFEHYEISSFAKPGKRSRHNSSYWQSKKYLGLGPGAHSFDGLGRQSNIPNNALYISSLKSGQLNMESEILLPRDHLNEYIMTSLRTKEGLDLQKVSDQFGNEKSLYLENNAKKYIESKKIVRKKENLILTDNGMLFADGIAASLFFD